MDLEELRERVVLIVAKCVELKDRYTSEFGASVGYACVFSHSDDEFESLVKLTNKMGRIIKETPTGPIFLIEAIPTVAGDLRILKVRRPFEDKPQLGYADFNIADYPSFKKKYLSKEGFKLTIRKDYEMIGLKDSSYDVFAYFAYPPIDEQLNVR